MYKKTGWGFALVAIILGGCIYFLFSTKFILGIDLRGGTELTYELDLGLSEKEGKAVVQEVKEQIAKRLDMYGLKEISIAAQGENRLVVQLPGAEGSQEVHDAIRIPYKRSTASSYDSALRAIELSVASPLKTAVITQVHRHNIDDLPRMHEQLAGLGVDVWQVQICMPLGRLLKLKDKYLIDVSQIGNLEDQLATFIEEGRLGIAVADNIGYYGRREAVIRGAHKYVRTFWTGCTAGCRVVAFCANGDVKGCPSHPREFVVGNIRQAAFAEIWQDRKRFAYNTGWREDQLEGGCARCAFKDICRAGCTTMAYAVTGTIYDNPFCIQRARPDLQLDAGDGAAEAEERAR